MLAALPMHDWPGVRASTDALWAAIRDHFRMAGVDAPDTLARPFAESDWLRPDLVLAQTCAMPFRLWLHDKVTLLGSPDYGLEDCPPGYYRSHIVAREGGAIGGTAAVNALHSQSGYAALAKHAGYPRRLILTGSHRASILAVASGIADYASIDAVTWRHAAREMPEIGDLQIVAHTEPTPGLPLIAGRSMAAAVLQPLIEQAIRSLAKRHRDALFLQGFVRLDPPDYL